MQPERFVNRLSAKRQLSPLRYLFSLPVSQNVVKVTTGMPNPSTFVFQEAELKYRDGTSCYLDEKLMANAQQYTEGKGLPVLVNQLKEIQNKIHKPLNDKWDLCVTLGSQDALCKAFEMILEVGDYVIVQEPVYPGILSVVQPYSPRYIAVESDEHGMKPSSLRHELRKRWATPEIARSAKTDFPKVLYCTPTGSNPTGLNWSFERKLEVYKIAQDYDFLIFEDDPYYFLDYGSDELPRSFLSLDTDGRVIRCDSFSKLISAGMRVGFCTGHLHFIDRIVKHMDVSSNCSSTCQVLVSETLTKWGFEGLLEHAKKVKIFYVNRRDIIIAAATKHLTGLAEWHYPQGGFFLWIKVKDLEDTYDMMMNKMNAHNVLLLPGRWCMIDQKPSPFLRASFSIITSDIAEQAFTNLAAMIREELQERKLQIN